MAGYIGTKAVSLSTTAADVSGDATIDGTLTVGTGVDVTGTVTADGLTVDGASSLNGDIAMNTGTPELRMYSPTSVNGYALLSNVSDTVDGGLSIKDVSGNVLANFKSNGDISFYEDTGTTAKLFWDASAESLGIGTSAPSNANLHIRSDSPVLKISDSSATGAGPILRMQREDTGVVAGDRIGEIEFYSNDASGAGPSPRALITAEAYDEYQRVDLFFQTAFFGDATPDKRVRVANNGDVEFYDNAGGTGLFWDASAVSLGIGTVNPTLGLLQVSGSVGSTYVTAAGNGLGFSRNSANYIGATGGSSSFLSFATGGTSLTDAAVQRMMIDSSGNLLVGTTSTATASTAGIVLGAANSIYATRSSEAPLWLNRLSTDGPIAYFRKNGTVVGSIATYANDRISIGSGNCYLAFPPNSLQVIPSSGTANSDNTIDLGSSGVRFDNVYATNGTIQTSDANEKQQIAELTAAEMQAAKAISGLFKTFKWNDSVAEKGDDARIHTGVIAQEVEAAMADAGLDAGRYAFFISSTWWESTEVIPAVEEVLDEEGSVVTEAQAERTVTHTHETAEEAPEGAVERNRKGIRYPQLLSFIGAATEQRLASIEARLDALEAN